MSEVGRFKVEVTRTSDSVCVCVCVCVIFGRQWTVCSVDRIVVKASVECEAVKYTAW